MFKFQWGWMEVGKVRKSGENCNSINNNDPWTWPTVWGLTVGAEGGLGGGRQREKNWDNCNSVNKSKKKKKRMKKSLISRSNRVST